VQKLENEFIYSDWITNPELWNREIFLERTKQYLFRKNSNIDEFDHHLLMMLVSQIEIYILGVRDIKNNGSVVYFNNGVTLGPNPQIGITDKALNRVLQLSKELELSPRARNGYQSNMEASVELKKFLAGPCGS
jgi:phage terminase small subunit